MRPLRSLLLLAALLLSPPALSAGPAEFDKAERLIAAGDWGGARDALEAGLRKAPDHANAWVNLGNVYLMQSEPALATSAFEHALQVDPKHYVAMNGLGTAALQQGKSEDAIRWFLEAVKVRPDYVTPLVNLGDLGMVLGRPEFAIQYYALALEVDPYNRKAALRLAELHIHAGLSDKAAGWLEPILARDPNDVEALLLTGRSFMEVGKPFRALESLVKAQALAPGREDVHRLVGLACLQTSQLPCAEDAYRHALEIDDRDPQTWVELGQVYRATPATWEKAMTCFANAASIDPRNVSAFFERGSLLEDQGDKAGAMESYSAAIHRDPAHCPSLSNLARMKALAGEPASAEQLLDKCLAADPGFTLARLNRGWIRADAGLCPSAKTDLQPLVDGGGPFSAQAAELLEKCGK